MFSIVRAELETARQIAEEFLILAKRLPYPGLAMRGHQALEVTSVHMGKFALALEHFQKGISLYDPEQHRDDAFLYSQNPGVAMHSHAGWALWFLGQPDQALERMHHACTVARELSEPHGLAHAYYFAAMLHILRRETKLAQELAERAIAVSIEHGLVIYEGFGRIARGWALAEQGLKEGSLEEIHQGLAIHQATGAKLARPQLLGLLAEALAKMQQTEEALRVLEEALALAHGRGEQRHLAELYRLKGELLLPDPAEAEACFHQALQIAQEQKARSWKLRASISLARLYRDRGKQEAARVLLTQVYNQFAEGFDTLDLRQAKALIDELSIVDNECSAGSA